MFFATYLVKRGLVSPAEFVEALERELYSRPPLGRIALLERKITMRQLFSILKDQSDSHQPFGKIAVDLGFMSEEDLGNLLLKQANCKPDMIDFLVEMGVIDQATLAAEKEAFYQEMAEKRETTMVHVVVQ